MAVPPDNGAQGYRRTCTGVTMDEPWGLSGSQFLVVYGLLFAMCVGYVLAARRAATAEAERQAAAERPLDPYEAAYLAGGAQRVVDTAVMSLASAGRVRVSRDGTLDVVTEESDHEVEAAVAASIAAHPRCRIGQVRERVQPDRRVVAVRDRLRDAGLLTGPETRRAMRRPVWVFAGLAALGLARLAEGLGRGRPVGFLILALLVTGAAAVVLVFLVPIRTAVGDRVLARLQASTERPYRYAGTAPAPAVAVGAVAVFGTYTMVDGDLHKALFSSADSSSAGGGGGCGGGCGGGGCGGCGCGG
jgi:uncharacterized protein (TIGR04222 family)